VQSIVIGAHPKSKVVVDSLAYQMQQLEEGRLSTMDAFYVRVNLLDLFELLKQAEGGKWATLRVADFLNSSSLITPELPAVALEYLWWPLRELPKYVPLVGPGMGWVMGILSGTGPAAEDRQTQIEMARARQGQALYSLVRAEQQADAQAQDTIQLYDLLEEDIAYLTRELHKAEQAVGDAESLVAAQNMDPLFAALTRLEEARAKLEEAQTARQRVVVDLNRMGMSVYDIHFWQAVVSKERKSPQTVEEAAEMSDSVRQAKNRQQIVELERKLWNQPQGSAYARADFGDAFSEVGDLSPVSHVGSQVDVRSLLLGSDAAEWRLRKAEANVDVERGNAVRFYLSAYSDFQKTSREALLWQEVAQAARQIADARRLAHEMGLQDFSDQETLDRRVRQAQEALVTSRRELVRLQGDLTGRFGGNDPSIRFALELPLASEKHATIKLEDIDQWLTGAQGYKASTQQPPSPLHLL
jgi:FMN-dependent NADH-azoreductase